METRELYKQKYEAQIQKWVSKLSGLQAQTELMTVQAKLDVQPHLDTLQSKVEAAKAKLEALASATDDTWDEVTKSVDSLWNDLKASAGGAYDAMKRHKPAQD